MALKKATETGSGEAAEADTKALAELEETALSGSDMSGGMVFGGLDGDISGVHVKPPLLKIRSGREHDGHNIAQGSVTIGDGNVIANPGEPVNIVVLSVRTYWKEDKKPYNPKHVPDVCKTRAQVYDRGGTTDKRVDPDRTEYRPAAIVVALVRKPDGIVSSLFGTTIGGADYAAVRWFIDKSAAAEALPRLVDDLSRGGLRARGYLSGVYEMKTVLRTFGNGNTTFVPKMRIVGYNSDETIGQIRELFAGVISGAASDDGTVDIAES